MKRSGKKLENPVIKYICYEYYSDNEIVINNDCNISI